MSRQFTLFATKGLPGSGKTYWAKQYQRDHKSVVLVCKDDLRAMLHQGHWSKGNEKQVVRIRDEIIKDALSLKQDVIVHDTNFHPPHIERLQALAEEYEAEFQVIDFTPVDLDICLQRDSQRPNPVGEKVIRDMWRKYLYVPPTPPEFKASLPLAIICDLDGTLALLGDRSPYDETGLCEHDEPNYPVIDTLNGWKKLDSNVNVIITSGRSQSLYMQTTAWLGKHDIPCDALFMREIGDKRKDAFIKREMYEKYIAGKYNILFVIDDRPQVVRMWREELGLFVFDVNQSGKDF